MELIKATNLQKKFGALVAVDGVDISVSGGQIFGFLGPNGAGKTTTIKMLTGVLSPDLGSIEIIGLSAR
jgi:ABC-2 type transport system ATP-binding protein